MQEEEQTSVQWPDRALEDLWVNGLLIHFIAASLLIIDCHAGIQKLHIRTVPLGEQPRRIAHQTSTKTLGVVTISTTAGPGPTGNGFDGSHIKMHAHMFMGRGQGPFQHMM